MKSKGLLFAVLIAAIGFGVWWYVSRLPISTHSHDEPGHSHEHTHGGSETHDHEHVGLAGATTHSHPHVHRHVHEEDLELELNGGLTEIGHLHVENGRAVYLMSATANVADGKISVQFWRNESGNEEVESVKCDHQLLSGTLIVGGKANAEFTLKEDAGVYVGEVPEGVVILPNCILGVETASVNGNEFSNIRVPILTEVEVVETD